VLGHELVDSAVEGCGFRGLVLREGVRRDGELRGRGEILGLGRGEGEGEGDLEGVGGGVRVFCLFFSGVLFSCLDLRVWRIGMKWE